MHFARIIMSLSANEHTIKVPYNYKKNIFHTPYSDWHKQPKKSVIPKRVTSSIFADPANKIIRRHSSIARPFFQVADNFTHSFINFVPPFTTVTII